MTEQCKVCGFPHDGDSHSDCIFAQSKEIERLREQRRWIPVSEKLPEDNGTGISEPVLTIFHTMFSGSAKTIRAYIPERRFWFDCSTGSLVNPNNVTHWMNLPEPPEVL